MISLHATKKPSVPISKGTDGFLCFSLVLRGIWFLVAGAMMGTAGASSAAAPTPAARYTQGADYRGAQ